VNGELFKQDREDLQQIRTMLAAKDPKDARIGKISTLLSPGAASPTSPLPKRPSFGEALETGLGIAGISPKTGEIEPGLGPMWENIKTTGKLLTSPEGRKSVARGAEELVTGAAKGLEKAGKSALDIYAAPGMYEFGGKVKPLSESVTAAATPFGGEQFAEAGRKAGMRAYAAAAGSFTAGAIQAALWFLPGKLGKAAKEQTSAGKTATLASGETLPVTRAMAAGREGSFEKLFAALPGGLPIRATQKAAQSAGKSVLLKLAQRTADRFGPAMGITTKDPASAFEVVGEGVRQEASQMHADLAEAMSKPGAVAPESPELASLAEKTVERIDASESLAKSPLAASVKDALARITGRKLSAGRRGGEEIQSVLTNPDVPASVRQAIASQLGTAETPLETYSAYRDARTSLLQIGRQLRKSGDWNSARIANELRENLDLGIERALRKQDPKLVETFKAANRLTSQGYALEDLAETIRGAVSGMPEEAQRGVQGIKPVPQRVAGGKLSARLAEAERSPVTGKSGLVTKAIGDPVDIRTMLGVAEVLDRAEATGSIAAKFHNLGIARAMIDVPLVAGGILKGSAAGGLEAALAFETGVFVVSMVMSGRLGAGLLIKYMRAPANSALEATLTRRLSKMAEESYNGKKKQ